MENENKSELVKKIIVLVLTLIGFITTIKLAIIYYNANFNPYALPSFCSVDEFIDCDGVAKTSESQFFGIPLAYWGLFLYSFITMLLQHLQALSRYVPAVFLLPSCDRPAAPHPSRDSI